MSIENATARSSRPRDHLWWFTGALFSPFVLVVALLWNTGRNEVARRATEARVLMDYGIFAVVELEKRTNQVLHNGQLEPTFHGFARHDSIGRDGLAKAPEPRDPGALLSQFREASTITRFARTAFRIDLPSRRITVAGVPYDSSTQRAIVRSILAAVAADTAHEPHRSLLDTLAGAQRFLWLWIDRDAPERGGGEPRAIYGVETTDSAVASIFATILKEHPILPAALLPPPYTADGLRVAVHSKSGQLLWTNDAGTPMSQSASDTLPLFLDGIVVSAHVGPRLASVLRIGKPSALYLPALIAMLVLSLALGATAFAQLRRNREVAQLRQRFIANVSHELRTPLTQMSMFAEMLETSRVRSADEARQFASVIHRETKRLSTLVEGVLHFSRGQEGAIRLQRERRDMESEIADALAFFRPMAAAANVSVTMEATPGITVNVDPGALRQVLLNLLDNAVKYGPRGQHITIALTRTSDSAMVAIRDEGRGIPLVDRDRVFDPYVRLHSATNASVAGAGIGMSVVRELVRAHDGRVWVAPTAGEGATIVFTIPLAATDAPITDRPVSDHPVEIR